MSDQTSGKQRFKRGKFYFFFACLLVTARSDMPNLYFTCTDAKFPRVLLKSKWWMTLTLVSKEPDKNDKAFVPLLG